MNFAGIVHNQKEITVFTLLELVNKLDTTKMKKPSFLMVLMGIGEYAYKRPDDGVLVVRIGCLKN